MLKNKAFTLIEILAVIIILGLLTSIAVPVVSKYIQESRNKTYISTTRAYVDGLAQEILSKNIKGLYEEDTTYYVPFKCIAVEKGEQSPYGDWDFGYVGVTINDGVKNYYVYTKDVKGMGIPLTKIDTIKDTSIKKITTDKDFLMRLEEDTSISIVPDSCDFKNLIVKEGMPFGYQPADSCFTITTAGVVTSNFPGGINQYGDFVPDKTSSCYSENLIIPNTINGFAVTSIKEEAFNAFGLSSVIIPNGVTKIEELAFNDNNLTSVTIPGTVTSIGNLAFSNNQLVSVTIPDSVTSIGTYAFAGNQLTSINLPSKLTVIRAFAFDDNQLASVTIPNNVTAIEKYAFAKNQLTSINLPSKLTVIGAFAFQNNQLNSITIPNNVTTIEQYAFNKNNLTSVTISDSVITIDEAAFMQNNLTSVTIPKNVTSIEIFAFWVNPLETVIFLGRNNTDDITLKAPWKGSGDEVFSP